MSAKELRRVALEGDLTIITAAERRQRLMSALHGSAGLKVDLSGIDEMDTAGLQILLLARREAGRASLTFEIAAASRAVTETLAVAHLTPALDGPWNADEEA